MFGRKEEEQVTRWQRHPEEFAVRIDVDDLKGVLQRGLVVEPGTNALLVKDGRNLGVVPPGRYTLENFMDKLASWVTGVPTQATALLVDVTPTDLVFDVRGRYTKDPLPIGLRLRLFVSVEEPGKFLLHVLKGRPRITQDDLRAFLFPEVRQVVDRWLRERTLQTLVDDPKALQVLELTLEEALGDTFRDTGLKFHRVRTVELDLEPYDRMKGERSRYALLMMEEETRAQGEAALAEVRLKARQRLLELQRQLDLQELAEESRKIERLERQAELYQRMFQAKMDMLRTEADFQRFLDEMDREHLLREREREELLRTWREADEDHELARRYLKEKLEVEYRHQLEMLRLHHQYAKDMARLEAELALARKKAEYELEQRKKLALQELEIERERMRIQQEKARLQMELERLQRQQERAEDWEDAKLGLEILAKLKEIKRLDEEERRRIAREDEIARQRAALEMEIRRWELRIREKEMEHRHELERMEYLAQMSVETLIALSGPDRARLLADLKKTEALKDMTDEQILALAAKEAPEVARAFQERYRAMAEGRLGQEERALYERLLKEQESRQKETLDTVKDLAEKSVDAMQDVGIAQAQGKEQSPVVITSGGTVSPDPSGGEAARPKRICPKCGRFVEENWRFCGFCGQSLEP